MRPTVAMAWLVLATSSGTEPVGRPTVSSRLAPPAITDDRFQATLRAAGVRPDRAGITRLLGKALPSSRHEEEIAGLIEDLGNDQFELRQRATTALLSLPIPPIDALQRAAKSRDLEVRVRASRILHQIGRGVHLRPLYAALRTIEKHRFQGFAELLLKLIPQWGDDAMQQAAQRALIATSTLDDVPRLRAAIGGRNRRSRIAAMRALASVLGAKADGDLAELLEDPDEQIRLAAAKVLADKGHRSCLRCLVLLLRSSDPRIRTTCIRYLQAMTGQSFPAARMTRAGDGGSQPRSWAEWLDQKAMTAPLRYPAGEVLHATWILKRGGRIQLGRPAASGWIWRSDQLPWGEVRIARADLQGTALADGDLANLNDLDRLVSLDLSDCPKLTGVGLEHLWSLVHLRQLSLQGTGVRDAGVGQLQFLSELRSLDLTRCGNITDAGVSGLRFLPRLAELRLEDTNVTDEGIRAIIAARGLRRLSLGRLITDAGLEQLSAMSTLTELSLSYSQVTGEGLKHLAGMKHLVTLRLYRCPRVSDAGMAHLQSLTGLRQLVVTCPRVTDLGLVSVARLRDLHHLDLYTTQVTNDGLRQLAVLTDLRYLNLARTRLTDNALQELRPLTRLTYLNLSHTAVSDAGLPLLSPLTKLSQLYLESTAVTGEGFRHLTSLSALQELHLHNSRVGDGALHWIARLPQLRYLDLSSTRISDHSLEVIGRLTNLRWLDIARTAVTDQGAEHLRNLTGLRHLNVRLTRISPESRKKLRDALPQLEEVVP